MISIGEFPSMYEESDNNSFKQSKKRKENIFDTEKYFKF